MPSMPGKPMSSTTAAGRWARIAASPASPSRSSCTPKPALARLSRITSAIADSSSITMISPRAGASVGTAELY